MAVVPLDSYYNDTTELTDEERKAINFDHPDAFDWKLLIKQVNELREGRAVEQPLFLRSYLNTILYTVVGTLIALLINIPAGYALSRRDLLGKKWLSVLYIVPMFVSGGLIPIYLTVKSIGLVDTFWDAVVEECSCNNNVVRRYCKWYNHYPECIDKSDTLHC